MKKIVFLMGLSLLITACANQQYAGNTDYAKVTEHEGPRQMGVRYLLGRGVPQNDQTAFEYFLKAAKQGDAFAQNEVAYLYARGKGTSQDYEQAFKYYQKAADHGLVSAEYNLGLLYLYGLGAPVNKEMAKSWIEKSAAKGFEPAKQALSNFS